MRRKDLEVTDRGRMGEILEAVRVIHMGLADGDEPYVVPMNYGFALDENSCVFYFHCAPEGRKLDIMARNPRVCLEATRLCRGAGRVESGHAQKYECVVASGRASLVEDLDEKIRGLELLRRHSGRPARDTSPELAAKITVFKVDVDEMTCKVR